MSSDNVSSSTHSNSANLQKWRDLHLLTEKGFVNAEGKTIPIESTEAAIPKLVEIDGDVNELKSKITCPWLSGWEFNKATYHIISAIEVKQVIPDAPR